MAGGDVKSKNGMALENIRNVRWQIEKRL